MSGSGGREKGLLIPSARLHTSLADVLSQGDISGHASALLSPKLNQSLDQMPEITKDSDQVDVSLNRPPLRNVYETSDLVIEPVCEVETASGETISEDEQMSEQDAVVEDLSSCSSIDQHEASDQACEDTLRDDFDNGSVAQSHWTEENSVTENYVECVPDKDDGSILGGQDKTAKIQKPSDSKTCFKETQQGSKTANTTQTKHAETKTCTPSKVRWTIFRNMQCTKLMVFAKARILLLFILRVRDFSTPLILNSKLHQALFCWGETCYYCFKWTDIQFSAGGQ